MDANTFRAEPDWAISPGEILAELLEERGLTQAELARRMDRPTKTINEIVRGKASLTPETALQLELATGASAAMWTNLEAEYRRQLARRAALITLGREVDFLGRFPIKALERHGVLPSEGEARDKLFALLSFFGVSSPEGWRNTWTSPRVAFRESPAYASAPEVVSTWLRWGELEGLKLDLAPFDQQHFEQLLDEVRSWTRERPFSFVLDRLKDRCAAAGVAFVVIPELPDLHLSGACHYLPTGNPVIQLTLRHKRDDQFWFSFYHECGHVLTGQRSVHLDEIEIDTREESEVLADNFARERLIPTNEWLPFVERNLFTEAATRAFARSVGVSPGIVVGRLQREGAIPRTRLNGLKSVLEWTP